MYCSSEVSRTSTQNTTARRSWHPTRANTENAAKSAPRLWGECERTNLKFLSAVNSDNFSTHRALFAAASGVRNAFRAFGLEVREKKKIRKINKLLPTYGTRWGTKKKKKRKRIRECCTRESFISLALSRVKPKFKMSLTIMMVLLSPEERVNKERLRKYNVKCCRRHYNWRPWKKGC